MEESLEQSATTISIDPNVLWHLLPQRLPGRIHSIDERYRKAARIKVLIPGILYPNGQPLDTVRCGDHGGLPEGTCVLFEWRRATSKQRAGTGNPNLIEATALHPCDETEIERVVKSYQDSVSLTLKEHLEGMQATLLAKANELEARERDFEARGGTAFALWELVQQAVTTQVSGEIPPDAVQGLHPPEDLMNTLRATLVARGFQIVPAVVQQCVVASTVAAVNGDILIMAGPTGVGKTSLVQQIAWMLGAGYEVIPVRPAWTDPTYLLGFYNPIQRCYQPTPFIHKLNEARKWEQANRLFFLCLDEMNLARIENYAADLLSRLEKSRYTNAFLDLYSPEEEHSLLTERKELAERVDVLKPEERRRLLLLHTRLDTFKARFLLPKNLVLCGTVNMDETTHPFSPKVLDRAFVVRFPSAQFGQIDSIRSIDERPTPAVWPLATPVLQELLNSQASEDFDKSLRGIWQEFLAWESAYLRPLGVQLGYRFPVTYKLFMHLGHKLLDANPRELASVFFQAKLLPRVSFNQQDKARGPDARKIDIFGQWRDDPSLDKYPKKDGFDLRQAFQDMIDRNAGRPVIQYW